MRSASNLYRATDALLQDIADLVGMEPSSIQLASDAVMAAAAIASKEDAALDDMIEWPSDDPPDWRPLAGIDEALAAVEAACAAGVAVPRGDFDLVALHLLLEGRISVCLALLTFACLVFLH